MLGNALRMIGRDRGYGQDWREYENLQGYTHLEELLIYQPKDWRKQAREYLFRFGCDLDRESHNEEHRTIVRDVGGSELSIFLERPSQVVLFHPDLEQTSRYEPLNFLLAYGVRDPLSSLMKDMGEDKRSLLMADLSPLDYFIEFQNYVVSYKIDLLRKVGKENSFPRLCLIKELDFSNIIGQRLAKQMIRQAMVNYIWNRDAKDGLCHTRQPLSMIFAGPSGNGKTGLFAQVSMCRGCWGGFDLTSSFLFLITREYIELAMWLAKLMNKPSDDEYFIKVDCGKLSDDKEIFGMSGPYQGAVQGSALNNFVLRLSCEPHSLGIVLLDEIEKASQGVIHGLYQVIDKGEWTNKRLTAQKGTQTETIACHNLVFIMTTNACDQEIYDYATRREDVYVTVGEDFEELGYELEGRIRSSLRYRFPFTDAFIGRVGRIVPFLPMANGDPEIQHPLLGEMMTVAKLLIERQQEKYASSASADIRQLVSAKTKHRMARIIVKDAIPEAGVRSIQKLVEARMGDRMVHTMLLERGGIPQGSEVEYFAKEEEEKIDFRTKQAGSSETHNLYDEEAGDEDMYA